MPFSSSKTNPPVFSRRSFALFFLAVFVLGLSYAFAANAGYTSVGKTYVLPSNPAYSYTDPKTKFTYSYFNNGDGTYLEVYKTDDGEYYMNDKFLTSDEFKKSQTTGQEAQKSSPGLVTGYIYDGLLRAFAWVCNLILYLFSFLVAIGGYILDFALYITSKFGFTQSEIVQAGWAIVRDIANMFFSVVLLVIAFATILRVETYGMKQVLWRLVVAALLINFSLVIAGVIIDASNVLTRFFLSTSPTTGGDTSLIGKTVSATLLKNMELAKWWDPGNESTAGNAIEGASLAGGKGFTNVLVNALLGIVVMIITAFVLFAAAILFYIRMVALWILLIFSPLAWLSMILPGTRSMVWNKWWHEFIKWIVFAPVYAFFLYLTTYITQKKLFLDNPAIQDIQSGLGDWENGTVGFIANQFFSNLSIITNYVIIIIFLLAGLIFARSSGIAGANVVTNMGKSYGRMWSRWAAKGGAVPGMGWVAKKTGISDKLNAWQTTGTGWRRGLANTLRGAGAVKRTTFTMMSPQSWSRAWAVRRQRADNESFGKGAGRIDDFMTGIGSIKQIGSRIAGSDTRSAAEKERLINEEAQKLYEARMRGDAQYEGINTSANAVRQHLAAKNISEWSPEAQQEMQAWDRQQAENIYSSKFRKEQRKGLGYVFNQAFGPNMREQMSDSQEVSRRQAEFQQTMRDEDQLVHNYLNAKNDTDKEALFRFVASINGLNTLFVRLGKEFNPTNLSQYIQQGFRKGRAEIIGADISAMASQNGNFSFVGTTAFDPRTGKIVFASPEQQRATAVKKAMEMEPQAWARQIHPDAWINRDSHGNQTEISTFAKNMLEQMTAAHINQIDRFQGRTLTALYKFRNQMEQHVTTITDNTQRQIAQAFVNKIKERYEQPK